MPALRLALLALTLLTLAPARPVAAQSFGFTFVSFSQNRGDLKHPILDNASQVVVKVTSTYELVEVVARIEGLTIPLAYSASRAGYVGVLGLSALSSGPKGLSIRATDIFGNQGETTLPITVNRRPIVSIATPSDREVVSPAMPLQISCQDEAQAGCSYVVQRRNGYSPEELLRATGSVISRTLDLSAYEGQKITLDITVRDEVGWEIALTRDVWVEGGPLLRAIDRAPDTLLDVNAEWLLYGTPVAYGGTDEPGYLGLHNRVDGSDQQIYAGYRPSSVVVTSDGALWSSAGLIGSQPPIDLYEWRNGERRRIGRPDVLNIIAEGDYAIWWIGGTIYRRNVVTGETVSLGQSFGFSCDFAPADILICSNYSNDQLVRSSGGVTTTLAGPSGALRYYAPRTDGTLTLVLRNQGGRNTYDTVVLTAEGEEILAEGLSYTADDYPDHMVRDGWAVFRRLGEGGTKQVWRRAPDGSIEKVTAFGASSKIDALGPGGRVLFSSGNSRYLSVPGQAPQRIGTALGTAIWKGEEPYIMLDQTLLGLRELPERLYLPAVRR